MIINTDVVILQVASWYINLSITSDFPSPVHADLDARLRYVLTPEQYASLPDTYVSRAHALLGIVVGNDPID